MEITAQLCTPNTSCPHRVAAGAKWSPPVQLSARLVLWGADLLSSQGEEKFSTSNLSDETPLS